MNRDDLRKRATELETEVKSAVSRRESGEITDAQLHEVIEKAYEEKDSISKSLDNYQKALAFSAGSDLVPSGPPEMVAKNNERFMAAKSISDEYANLKAAAMGKRQGSFAFDLGLKTQGETGLQGENSYGTTAGTALTGGQYFLPGTAGPDVLPNWVPGILELRWYDNVFASLWPTFPTESPVVSYVRESSWTNAAAATNEGATFPTSTNSITRYTAQLGKVSNLARVTDEMIQDAPYFWALVQKRTAQGVSREEEVQLLAGSGYPGVSGLLGLTTSFTKPQTVTAVTNLVVPSTGTAGEGASSATISSVTPGRSIVSSGASGSAPSGSDIAIGVLAMLTDIRVTHFFEPTAIVMNPNDWFTVRTWTDKNGQFFAGSPMGRDYGYQQNDVNPAIQAVDEALQLWGKRVVTTPAIPQGYILVGDFTDGGMVLRKGGLRVELVNTNGTDFEQGLWTMRAYSRIGLAVERPELFELAVLTNAA